MDIKDKEEADQLYGRMMESCDIELAIESGQFKTVEDVHLAVRSRSEAINQAFKKARLFPVGDAQAKLEIAHAERERAVAGLSTHDDADLLVDEVALDYAGDSDSAGRGAFKIHHRYDIGNQAVHIQCGAGSPDVPRAAAYVVGMAEEWFGNVLVSNLGVAAALVQFYGCTHCAAESATGSIDLYSVIAEAGYESVMADASLRRNGLQDFIQPHTQVAG